MHLFRIHIRPKGGSASEKTAVDYCLENGVLGVGWRINSTKNLTEWEEYLKEAIPLHKKVQVCKYIKMWVSKDDLVWTRNTEGKYFLAKVESGWEYWMSEKAIEMNIDIANIFRVKFLPVEPDAVPGKVVACFRATRTIQKIQSRPAIEYSKHLWNILSQSVEFEVDSNYASDIFEMLDDEETEDLIFMYPQYNGWFLVPNSRKKDTMSYEFLAVNPKTGERAISQVKTGNSGINRDDYASYSDRVFLFQSKEIYAGTESENIVCLSRKQMLEFLKQAKLWLPSTIQKKIDLMESINTK